MTSFAVGIDYGSGHNDAKIMSDVVNAIKANGCQAEAIAVGPNKVQAYGKTSAAKGKTAVYIANGVGISTPEDFEIGIGRYYKYDFCVFVWPQWIGNQYMTDDQIQNHVITRAAESDINLNVKSGTAAQYFSSKNNVALVAAKTPEEIGKMLCSGQYTVGKNGSHFGGIETSQSTNGQNGQEANISTLLTGEWTFQELISEICNGIDLVFLAKKNGPVVTDFETLYTEAQYLRETNKDSVSAEDIQLWQLQDGTYELNVDQYGFYNTVKIVYNKGVITESFPDLVRIFGEVSKTYYRKELTKTQAKQIAKTYLAAHLRDFNMSIQASILHDGGIDIGDIVTLENPLTLQNQIQTLNGQLPEYYFVNGISIDWEDGYMSNDIELLYSPESPERKDMPEIGANYSNSSEDNSSFESSQNSGQSSNCISKYWENSYNMIWKSGTPEGISHNPITAYKVFKDGSNIKSADCFTHTAWMYYVYNFICKIPARDVVSHSSQKSNSGSHHVIQIYQNGSWIFPSEYSGMKEGLQMHDYIQNGLYKVFRGPPTKTGDVNTIPGEQSSAQDYFYNWSKQHGYLL